MKGTVNRRRPKAEVVAAAKSATVPSWVEGVRLLPSLAKPSAWTLRMRRNLTATARAYAGKLDEFVEGDCDEAALVGVEVALEFAAVAFTEAWKSDADIASKAAHTPRRRMGKA